MVCRTKVALLVPLCCIFPGAHSALSGEGTVALDSSATSPFDFLVKNSVPLDKMDIEKCHNEMSKIEISTNAELDALVKDFNDKITISLGETAKFLKGTAIPSEEEAVIKERINAASRLVIAFPGDPDKLALAAIKTKHETLLDLLQVTNIWKDSRQRHWFKVLLKHVGFEHKGKLHDEHEELFPTDWRNNFSLICEFDSDILAEKVWNKVKDEALKDDFEEFSENVLRFCAQYDAAKVFEALKFTPIQLKKYFELMKNYNSTNLLKLYQDAKEKQVYSYLDTLTLPKSVEELDRMLLNPSDFPRMDWFIEKCCKEGRLDLLKRLRGLHQSLIPNMNGIYLATRKKRVNVVEWLYKENLFYLDLAVISAKLTVGGNVQILEPFLKKSHFDHDQSRTANVAISVVVLDIIRLIHQKWPTAFNNQVCADSAAIHNHLPVLRWLNAEFGLLPDIKWMRYATTDMLDWITSKLESKALDYTAFFGKGYEPISFDAIRWIHKKASSFDFSKRQKQISKAIRNHKDMIWARKNLNIQPDYMGWAFGAGDLEAIELAGEMFNYVPSDFDVSYAVCNGNLHIIKWLHKRHPNILNEKVIDNLLLHAIGYGYLKLADYLVATNLPVKKGVIPWIDNSVRADRRLNTLKWIHRHSSLFGMPDANSKISRAVEHGDLDVLQWYDQNNTTAISSGPELRELAMRNGQSEVYEWLLEKYFKGDQQSGLDEDLRLALDKGNLEVVKMILEKDRSQDGKKFTIKNVDRSNYLTMRWLKANDRWQ